MAVIFTEGFDCYGTGSGVTTGLGAKWGIVPTSGITGVTGFSQGLAVNMTSGELISSRLPNNQTAIIGFWFKRSASAIGDFCRLSDGFYDWVLRMKSNSTIEAYKEDLSGVTLVESIFGSGTATISNDTWYFIEWKLYVDNINGSIQVRVNGKDDINLTGLNTLLPTNMNYYCNEFSFLGQTGGYSFDHVYVIDTNGATNNDFLGESQIESIKPSENGASSDGTTVGAAQNYLAVNESAPDEDSSYNEFSNSSEKDTYIFDKTFLNGEMFSVNHYSLSRKDDIGGATYRNIIKIGGSQYNGTTNPAYDDYLYTNEISETNPATSIRWDKATIDNMEFGCERIS